MRIKFLFPYLRVIAFILIAPVIYLFWEWGGAERLQESVHAPVSVTAIRVGSPAPEIVVGKENIWVKQNFRLSSLKGYPVVLHFWATWCGPCVQELPELMKLAQRLQPQGYTFVAVAVNDTWQTVDTFFKQYPHLKGMSDHMALVLDGDGGIAKSYGSSRFPETFLINDQMVMDNKFIGAQPWNDPLMEPYLRSLKTKP